MQVDADEKRYDIVLDAYERQFRRAERLDSKISSAVTISGTLMTLFLALGTFMLGKVGRDNPYRPVLAVVLADGLVLFAIEILVLLRAYRLSRYRFDPDPSKIIDAFGNAGLVPLLLQVTSNLADSTIDNLEANNQKARDLTLGFALL